MLQTIQKAQKGDRCAQQALYLDSCKSVYYLALKILKNPDDAEDITQDVFITAFEKLPELRQPAAYYKWLNRITATRCMNSLRRKSTVVTDELDEGALFELADDSLSVMPEELMDDAETRRIIMEIIEQLPDAQRVCVLYRYYSQMSIEEIAEVVSANVHTVRSRLALARKKIRDAILAKEEKEGIRLHAIPLMPILLKGMEDFQLPEGLADGMWANVSAATEGLAAQVSSTAASGAAGSQGVGTAAATGAGIGVKVIGIVASVVIVGAVAAGVILSQPIDTPANLAVTNEGYSSSASTAADTLIDDANQEKDAASEGSRFDAAPSMAAETDWDGIYTSGDITVEIYKAGTQDAYVKVEEEFASVVDLVFDGDTAYGEYFYNDAMMYGEGYGEVDPGDTPQETRYSITITLQDNGLLYARRTTIIPPEGGEPQEIGSIVVPLTKQK